MAYYLVCIFWWNIAYFDDFEKEKNLIMVYIKLKQNSSIPKKQYGRKRQWAEKNYDGVLWIDKKIHSGRMVTAS